MSTKFYCILAIVLFSFVQVRNTASITNYKSPLIAEYVEHCLRESRANPEHIIFLKNGVIHSPNYALKNWLLCYLSRTGVMSPEGVLKQHVVMKKVAKQDKDLVEKIIDKCLFKTPHEPVDTAWKYLTCFRKRQPQYAREINHI
ncbi:uncharacterized protein LOC116774048 [Danaus plexippus]|uniref:uncharacterized protein LOC116774048 n=1 Tax=Danaus plexippus TaxID=13037 RepID=UPI002AB09E03|nr:uncharacterized protein LOC116774048 [Danaus plexippus]